MQTREHLFFSGRVQGVGFRFRAYYLAQSLGLTGWVCNCDDERVEMEVQGEAMQIQELIQALQRQRFIEIDTVDQKTIPLRKEHSFQVLD